MDKNYLTDGWIDGPMDGPTDGPTAGPGPVLKTYKKGAMFLEMQNFAFRDRLRILRKTSQGMEANFLFFSLNFSNWF